MRNKVTKKALQLLRNVFARDGVVRGSAIDTDQGSLPLWGQLVAAGYVEQRPRSLLGHDYSYGITKAGEIAAITPDSGNGEGKV